MSSRREARERVMQALYAYQLSNSDTELLIASVLEDNLAEDQKTYRFAKKLFLRTIDQMDELDEIISGHADNWDLSRIALIDRILLRMATCEFLSFEDIPPKVSIDEALEVAKKYSTDNSPSFINGVLDAVLIDLKEQGRLQKSGRGLIGMESIEERTNS